MRDRWTPISDRNKLVGIALLGLAVFLMATALYVVQTRSDVLFLPAMCATLILVYLGMILILASWGFLGRRL